VFRYRDGVVSPIRDPAPHSVRDRESQTVRAVIELRELLLQGAFKPGERIREVPLAARLQVSRTPLHLALERLADESLLEARSTTGFVVREFSVQDVLDAIDLRGVLEGTAARFAAERLQSREETVVLSEDVEAARRLLRREMPGVDLIREYMLINANFHAHLLRLAKSSLLANSMERVLALPFASPNTFAFIAEPEELKEILLISNSQHAAITDAIVNREAARAEAVAREHSRIVRTGVTIALQERRVERIPGGSLIKFPALSDGGGAT
jgi:GntR family transcriptional regulator, vanillate catabolism transcriptional regulator